MARNPFRESDWRGQDMLSLNRVKAERPLSRKTGWIDRLSKFTFKAASTAFASTIFIMFIFDITGQYTHSSLAHIAGIIVGVTWFIPDLLSIPLVGVMAIVGSVAALMQLQTENILRNMLAIGLSLGNVYLVMHSVLTLLPF